MTIRVKASLLSLAMTAGIGLMALPAHADNEVFIEQDATQSTAVVGDGNAAATANEQVANIRQRMQTRGRGSTYNGASVRQTVDQATGVVGHGNAVGTDNRQNATIDQLRKTPRPMMIRRGHR